MPLRYDYTFLTVILFISSTVPSVTSHKPKVGGRKESLWDSRRKHLPGGPVVDGQGHRESDDKNRWSCQRRSTPLIHRMVIVFDSSPSEMKE